MNEYGCFTALTALAERCLLRKQTSFYVLFLADERNSRCIFTFDDVRNQAGTTTGTLVHNWIDSGTCRRPLPRIDCGACTQARTHTHAHTRAYTRSRARNLSISLDRWYCTSTLKWLQWRKKCQAKRMSRRKPLFIWRRAVKTFLLGQQDKHCSSGYIACMQVFPIYRCMPIWIIRQACSIFFDNPKVDKGFPNSNVICN